MVLDTINAPPINITITVTQEDIDHGFIHDCDNCPIAMAIRSQFPDADIEVVMTMCSINGRIYDLPREASNFIKQFDAQEVLPEPFSFVLGTPYPLPDRL